MYALLSRRLVFVIQNHCNTWRTHMNYGTQKMVSKTRILSSINWISSIRWLNFVVINDIYLGNHMIVSTIIKRKWQEDTWK